MNTTQPLRILQMIEPGCDGAFHHVNDLVGFLLAAGQKVSLVYSSVRPSDRLFELVERVASAGGQVMDMQVGNRPCLGDFRVLKKLLPLIRTGKFDVVHVHCFKAGFLGRVAAFRCQVPCLYTPHGYPSAKGYSGKLQAQVVRTFEKVLRHRAFSIHVSEAEMTFARTVLGLNPNKQCVIHNGINLDVFCAADVDRKRRLRAKLGIPEDRILLGTVGRLCAEKDPVTLYRSFARFRCACPNVHFCHLGRGELRSDVDAVVREQSLENDVTRIDYSRDPVEFYQCLDVFVLTSVTEGLPISVIEAMACNLPMILSDIPGTRLFKQLGLTSAWYCQPQSPDEFAAAMQQWHGLHSSAAPPNHRQAVEQHFSAATNYRKILDLYRRLCRPVETSRIHGLVL
jgi:glycosyltransferase involved in cell wall biosynthesis